MLWPQFSRTPYGLRLTEASTPAEMVEADHFGFAQTLRNIRHNPGGYLRSRFRALPHLFLTSFDSFTGNYRSFRPIFASRDVLLTTVKISMMGIFSLAPIVLGVFGRPSIRRNRSPRFAPPFGLLLVWSCVHVDRTRKWLWFRSSGSCSSGSARGSDRPAGSAPADLHLLRAVLHLSFHFIPRATQIRNFIPSKSASERTILRGIVALRVRANAKEARTHADVDSVRSLVASPPTIETFIPSSGSPGNQHSPRRPPSPPSPGRMCVGPSTSPAPLPRRDRRGHCSVLIGRGTAQPRNTKRRLRNRNDATFSGLAR